MKRIYTSISVLILILSICSMVAAEDRLRMSTTTSTQDSGLLKVLLPPFEKRYNCTVDVIAVGNAFKGSTSDLVVLFQGEKGLFNPYGVIAVNPKKHLHVKHNLALKFIDFITSSEGQGIIAGYTVRGEPVFFTSGKK